MAVDPLALLPALALVAAAVLPAATTPVSDRAQVPLDVMTFNIRYGTANDGENRWEVRRPRTIEAIRRHPAATIGLQEALAEQVDTLVAALPGYEAVGVGRDDGKAAGEHSAILFDRARLKLLRSDTFWLSDTPAVPGSKSWGNRITRICTWAYFLDRKTGGYLYHFNAHLDHESQPSRERAIALILARIAARGTDDPVIVTGDFNVGEDNAVLAATKAAGYRDSFRVAHPNATEVGTFHAWNPAFGPDKIDYILVGANARVESAEIVRDRFGGGWPSDHAPVTARIVLDPSR